MGFGGNFGFVRRRSHWKMMIPHSKWLHTGKRSALSRHGISKMSPTIRIRWGDCSTLMADWLFLDQIKEDALEDDHFR